MIYLLLFVVFTMAELEEISAVLALFYLVFLKSLFDLALKINTTLNCIENPIIALFIVSFVLLFPLVCIFSLNAKLKGNK